MQVLHLNILTLNVWGIPFVSSDREVRIEAISEELSSGRYDIVSLQEVWSQSDSEKLQKQTETVLPYSHYFHSGVIGAGLLVLSKYPIIGTLFHAWSVNGYFHRIQHADWFGGKGVGLCRILIGDQLVHLYNAHLHAEYDDINDEYKTHRVIQAFDTAQFIDATRGSSALQILAGDLNTKPVDITYKVLLHTSQMVDSCASEDVTTNECQRNSYTSKRALIKNPDGIRIDHIFIRNPEHVNAEIIEYTLPFPDRVPGQKFSYSDHEAVLTKLKLTRREVESSPIETAAVTCTMYNHQNGDTCLRRAESTLDQCNTCNEVPYASDRNDALQESIALCEASLQQLNTDRIIYYLVAMLLFLLVIILVNFTVPIGFKTLYLLLKFLIFGVILYCVFMASIWNLMERNGILSGKTSMQIMLRNAQKLANLKI